jgi:hypothetical protein
MNREQEILRQLKLFTVDCRFDMHEPDEQGISAEVVGDHLDNAMGNCIMAESNIRQEFVVILKNEDNEELKVNLADLIALARLAKFPTNYGNNVYEELMGKAGFENGGKGEYYTDEEESITANLNEGLTTHNLKRIVDGAFDKGQRLLKEELNNLIKI